MGDIKGIVIVIIIIFVLTHHKGASHGRVSRLLIRRIEILTIFLPAHAIFHYCFNFLIINDILNNIDCCKVFEGVFGSAQIFLNRFMMSFS
jgi:hypothetical protein